MVVLKIKSSTISTENIVRLRMDSGDRPVIHCPPTTGWLGGRSTTCAVNAGRPSHPCVVGALADPAPWIQTAIYRNRLGERGDCSVEQLGLATVRLYGKRFQQPCFQFLRTALLSVHLARRRKVPAKTRTFPTNILKYNSLRGRNPEAT